MASRRLPDEVIIYIRYQKRLLFLILDETEQKATILPKVEHNACGVANTSPYVADTGTVHL